ncbi:MAG TPA: hypothetical protein VMF61_10030 [Candidatus Acidoferrales bacterium]|nr:hypothetical protein [Candidatus Acidoferrales bacterium]
MVSRLTALTAVLTLALSPAGPKPFSPFPASGQLFYQDVSFDRSGETLYLTRIDGAIHTIVVSRIHAGAWPVPVVVPFSGRWRDLEQVLSPDGRTMIFASNRPALSGGKPIDAFFGGKRRPARGGNLWSVARNATGWGTPVRLPDAVNANTSTFSPALSADGTLYFMRASGAKQRFHIFVAERKAGTYPASAPAPFSDVRYSDFDPAVASDGSFVIFGSNRPPAKKGSADLFIAYHRAGGWTTPRDMGRTLDGAGDVIEPRLSPDERTLYFTKSTTPNPLWSVDLTPWLAQTDRGA